MTVALTREVGVCDHCGRTDMDVKKVGATFIDGALLCHPKVAGRPDCLRLVVEFGHPMNCRCEERYPVAGDRARSVWA